MSDLAARRSNIEVCRFDARAERERNEAAPYIRRRPEVPDLLAPPMNNFVSATSRSTKASSSFPIHQYENIGLCMRAQVNTIQEIDTRNGGESSTDPSTWSLILPLKLRAGSSGVCHQKPTFPGGDILQLRSF